MAECCLKWCGAVPFGTEMCRSIVQCNTHDKNALGGLQIQNTNQCGIAEQVPRFDSWNWQVPLCFACKLGFRPQPSVARHLNPPGQTPLVLPCEGSVLLILSAVARPQSPALRQLNPLQTTPNSVLKVQAMQWCKTAYPLDCSDPSLLQLCT